MKKDVIYIDTEDDITSIIEKVKSSTAKIIALVPPKRVGVLQSAVNLKLLHKAAGAADRHLVLITSDKALASLAAGVQIPVAKTLQSRPELANTADAPADDGEEVINGEELPVGELQKSAAPPPVNPEDEEIVLPENLAGDKPKPVTPSKKGKSQKIPNFDKFRKKLFFIIGGVILFIIFLIWAIFFAPHAEVNIKAKTSNVDVALPVSLNTGATTNPAQAVIKPLVQQVKKTNSADFNATGKKDVGEKASGTVTINNCSTQAPDSIAVPAGSAVSSDGLNFITASSVTVPGGRSSRAFGGCDRPGQVSVAVSAQDIGESYNLKRGSTFTVAGQSSAVNANNSNDFGGGSKRQITVVSDADITSAQQKITGQDPNPTKQELTNQFKADDVIILGDSFAVSPGTPSISPAVGTEAGSGRVTIETTYTLFAIDKDDAAKTLEAVIKTKIKDQKDQRVYDTGFKKLKLLQYTATDGGGTVQFVTTGQTGPTIDAGKLKPQLVGKNYEEIRQLIKGVKGVDDVDTKFSPFWVSSAPDAKKIDIKFSVSQK